MASSNVRTIPISDIQESPDNYRKTFDPAEMASLTASVKEFGVLQDVTVRPDPAAKGKFIVTDGARRFRAAKGAGLDKLQVKVEEADDKAARRQMVILNEQRADVPLLEKVDGYQRLIDDGSKLEEVAAIAGKGVGSMRALLKLKNLPAFARTALERGYISESIAVLIAAQATDDMRKKVSNWIFDDWDGRENMDPDIFIPTVKEVKDFISRELRVELKQAPFNVNEKNLVEGVGTCQACPKRAGNNKEEYGELRADTCLDPECFRAKSAAFHQREDLRREKECGILLPQAEADKLFPFGSYLSTDGPYWNLAEPNFLLDGPRHSEPWGKLLKGHINSAAVVGARDKTGRLQLLVNKETARQVLKEHYGYKAGGQGANGQAAGDKEEKAREKERAKVRERREKLVDDLGHRAAEALKGITLPPPAAELVRLAIARLLRSTFGAARDRVLSRCGIKRNDAGDKTELLIDKVAKAKDADVLELLTYSLAEAVLDLGGAEEEKQVANWFKSAGQKPAKGKPGRPKKAKVSK